MILNDDAYMHVILECKITSTDLVNAKDLDSVSRQDFLEGPLPLDNTLCPTLNYRDSKVTLLPDSRNIEVCRLVTYLHSDT